MLIVETPERRSHRPVPLHPDVQDWLWHYPTHRITRRWRKDGWVWAPLYQFAVAFDAATNGTNYPGDGTTVSGSITIGSITNGLLNIHVCITDDFAPSSNPASVTVGGSATGVTLVTTNGIAGQVRNWWYRKVLGTTAGGATTLAVTMTDTPEGYIQIEGTTYSGVDQTTPISNATSATGTSTGPTVNVTSTSGLTIVDTMTWRSNTDGSTATAGAGQTRRYTTDAFGSRAEASSDETAAGASTTMSYTLSVSHQWSILAGQLNAASAGGTAGLFMQSTMTGLGSGGQFFANPLEI